MKSLWSIYSKDIPEFILEFSNTKEFKRLDDVGMNCGCEYTSFAKFNNCKEYSRFVHSISVSLIIWNFTKDIKQSVAGLFHDIATPVFAHTIDFLNGDHENQESTEENTREIIENSDEIIRLLKKYNLKVDEICDYHIYEIADNDSPKLSADRLEYSFGNMINYGFCPFEKVIEFYNDLVVGVNEFNENEIMFKTKSLAVEFSKMIYKNSLLYVSDEDRGSMQRLADVIKFAVDKGVLSQKDLYKTESYVIEKLKSDVETKKLWEEYSQYSIVKNSLEKVNENWICVPAKKRYIDCYIENIGRVSSFSDEVYENIESIKNLKFDYWITLE